MCFFFTCWHHGGWFVFCWLFTFGCTNPQIMAKKAAVKEAVAAVAPQVVVVDAPQVVQIPVEVVILDPVVVPPNALLAA